MLFALFAGVVVVIAAGALVVISGSSTSDPAPAVVAPAPAAPAPAAPAPAAPASVAPPEQEPAADRGQAGRITPGVYRAMPKSIEGGNEGTALEFKVVGSGKDAEVEWLVGFGMQPTICKDGGEPDDGPITFLDDEPKGTRVTDGGRKLEAEFETGLLTATVAGSKTMTGDLAFSFDDLVCGGVIDFEVRRTKQGDRALYDRVVLAGS